MLAESLLILTMNIFFEARGETLAGQQAVADTVITRVHDTRWPSSVKKVVLQRNQFSWVKEKKVRNTFDLMALKDTILHSKKATKQEVESYRMAEKVARRALQKGYRPAHKFTHFHTVTTRPFWAKKKGRRIGNHIFYKL